MYLQGLESGHSLANADTSQGIRQPQTPRSWEGRYNCDLDSINLFKGYTQENASTHAFLAFLNFLLRTEPKLFLAFCRSRNFGGIKIEPKTSK